MSKFRNFEKYEVFEDGKIWSYKSNKFLKPRTRKDGYQQVRLSDNEGKIKLYYIHRIVWEAVTGAPIPKGYEINHISEDKEENMITNLELVSHKENCNFGTCSKRSAKTRSKQVGAYKDGKLIMTFESTQEAERNGFYSGNVSACCCNSYLREGNNIYKGYTWRYI